MGWSQYLGLGPVNYETNDLPYWHPNMEPKRWLQPTRFGDLRVTVDENDVDGEFVVSRKICVVEPASYYPDNRPIMTRGERPYLPSNSNGYVGMENPNNVDGLVSIALKITGAAIDQLILKLQWERGPRYDYFIQTIFKENNTNEE